jgi:hypothetical protein
VRRLLQSGEMPPPLNDDHCRACSLRDLCQPEATGANAGTLGSSEHSLFEWKTDMQLLNTLYVTTPESYIHLDNDTLRVEVEKETRLRVPLHHLSAVVCFGLCVGVAAADAQTGGQRHQPGFARQPWAFQGAAGRRRFRAMCCCGRRSMAWP